MARRCGWLLAVAWLVTSAGAQAQGDEFSLDDPGATEEPLPAPTVPAEGPTLLSDEQALQEESAPDERFRQSTDPREDPNKKYFFLGAAWRYVRMPSWALEWFLESAPAVGTAGSFFGEFAYRKDGFQIAASVGWMKWDFTGPFQLKGDPAVDTEWLEARWNLLAATATFTWSTNFTDWMSLEYGVEAGLAFLFGDMTRTEAYNSNGQWAPCPGWAGGPNLPNPTPDQLVYCDQPIPESGSATPPTVSNSAGAEGAHYGVRANKGIANSGVPRAVPVLGPRLSLRFKPLAQLVLRVDVPLPILPFGFVGGISAQYGF